MVADRHERQADVLVLGAGIIGVCVALHLQKRGRSVILVDRKEPGEETSYGNAGLIERSSVVPYGAPREFRTLLHYAFNRSADVRLDWTYLPRLAPWLWRFWRESAPERLAKAATDMWPLIRASVAEHDVLAKEAGAANSLRKEGWIEAFRSEASFEKALRAATSMAPYDLCYEVLGAKDLRRREPDLSGDLVGGIHWRDPATVDDPGGLVKSYASLFVRGGGGVCKADAQTLRQENNGWRVDGETGGIFARDTVVALGPWSADLLGGLGYRLPFAVKRGYHVHYEPKGEAKLNHPVVDIDGGYLLAPMRQGIRLATGIEFAPRDSSPNYSQLNAAEPLARRTFPLDRRIEARPWMGSRPCLADMRPVIGSAGKHKNLWLAFGHNHHGLTLGPVTGRLLAEMMTGQVPFTDPGPYAITRFS